MALAQAAVGDPRPSLRPMTDGDMAFAEALYAADRAAEFAASGWPADTLALFLRDQFRLRHRHYRQCYPAANWLIVEAGGAAIGHLCTDETAHRIHVVDITLLPAERGRGHGTAILTDLLAAASRKRKPVSMHVERTNRALGLYLRLGFVEVEDRGLHLLLQSTPAA